MPRDDGDRRRDVLPGTLDMLVLKTLSLGVMHGYGIAQHIHRLSGEVLDVEEGSLYPALQRMQLRGWVTSEWRMSPTNRRARYYRLTTAGKRQLAEQVSDFDHVVGAIGRVLRTAE